ncbi:MAG TPA: hypothetical protein VMU95_29640 [Trebonia sp.]|nr:hypothetical protein [Trebonia sp.]
MTKKLGKPRWISLAGAHRRLALALIASAVALSAGVFAVPAEAAANLYDVAFQGANSDLWYYASTSSGVSAHDTGIAMDWLSAPSIALVSGGDNPSYVIAYENGDDQLSLYYPANGQNTNTGIQMESGTNPVIASNDIVAFQGINGDLFYWNGTAHDTGRWMGSVAEANPAISPDGQEIAFRGATNNHLWTYNIPTGSAVDTGLGMDYNSENASVGDNTSGGYSVAFEGTNKDLWEYYSGSGHDLHLGMAEFTSPAITPNTGLIAFQANTGSLWYYSAGHGTNTKLGVAPDTSPAAGLSVDSTSGANIGYQIWWVASGSYDLWQYTTSNSLGVNTAAAVENSGLDETTVSYTPGVQLETG